MKRVIAMPWSWVQVAVVSVLLFGLLANIVLAVLIYLKVSQ